VVPGTPDASLIVQKVEAGEMPPPDMQYDYAVRNPTDAEVATLRKWVAAGAPPAPDETGSPEPTPQLAGADGDHWAFLPPQRPAVPRVTSQQMVSNPVDAFLLRKLEGSGLSYSEEAAPLTLLRRAYLHLTGMPPPPQEIERYLQDDRHNRYQLLIERLLDAPEYGERWARHWLDIAGHIDTEGFGEYAPRRQNAWRYRDYVIRAFNRDRPFDEFLTEQIAGDELDQLVVAPMTVDQHQAPKPRDNHGFPQVGQDSIVGLGGEREGTAKGQVVMGGTKGQGGSNQNGNGPTGLFRGSPRHMLDGQEIGADRQVRTMLLDGADRQHQKRFGSQFPCFLTGDLMKQNRRIHE